MEEVQDYLLQTESNGSTALHRASSDGRLDVVQYLLAQGVDVNAKDEHTCTPLHRASRNGCIEVVRYLIEKGADVNAETSTGSTPVHEAAGSSRKYLSLLSTPRRVEDVWRRPVVALLIESGADVNCSLPNGRSLLHVASRAGWLEIVQDIISKGADVNAKEKLYYDLLEPSEARGLEKSRLSMRKNKRTRFDFDDPTPLFYAAHHFHKSIVELLIESGANVDFRTRSRWTLLHYASKGRWPKLTQDLIEKGFDINARTIEGYTPLYLASTCPNIEVIKCLLVAGADCNAEIKLENYEETAKTTTPFEKIIQSLSISVELLELFIQHGGYFKTIDYYNVIAKNPWLKKGVLELLQDINFCSQAILNKFLYADLPAVNKLPLIKKNQSKPSIEKRINMNMPSIVQEIKNAVKWDIQTKGHVNVLKTSPIILSMLSIKSLLGPSTKDVACPKAIERPPLPIIPPYHFVMDASGMMIMRDSF